MWKLFHIHLSLESASSSITAKNLELDPLRSAASEHDKELKAARREQAKALKEAAKAEKALKRREHDLDELRPGMLEVEEKIAHSTRKKERSTGIKKTVERECKDKDAAVNKLKADQVTVQNAERAFKGPSPSVPQNSG